MLISEFIDRIALRLRDQSKRQWTQEYLVQATDAAFQALCDVVPQAYTVHRDITLVEGTEQSLDDDLHRIVHILGNVCTDGTLKRAVTKTDLSLMDRQHPHWRSDATRGYVWNYMLNALSEQKFFVWPPATAGTLLRVQASATPCITVGGGVTPTAPTAPVDPGPLGTGGDIAADGYVDTSVIALTSAITMTWTDPLIGLSSGEIIDFMLPDVSTLSGNVSINEILYQVPYGGGGSFDGLHDTDEITLMAWGDPRLVEGEIIRIVFDGAPHILGFNLYNEGTTQAEIDAYTALQAQYVIDLAAYNALIALPALYIDEDLPFDKVHMPALEEWAMYYCLMRDGEETGNSGRAMQHHNNFYQLMNKRDDSDVSIKTGEGESEV